MAGSEKCIYWDFECHFPQWPDRRQQSVSIDKHDGEGFPKLGNPDLRQDVKLQIANYLGVCVDSIRCIRTPWGIDELIITQKPSLQEFQSYEDAVRLSCNIYNLCQFTRSEQIAQWNKAKEQIRQKMKERGWK